MKITKSSLIVGAANLRKSKKNWMEGTLGAGLCLQQQQAKMHPFKAMPKCDETLDEATSLILTVLGQYAQDEELPLLQTVQAGLDVHKIHLKKLESLFHYPPYPKLKTLIEILEANTRVVGDFIHAFDKDPKAGRRTQVNQFGYATKETEVIIAAQFDTSRVGHVLEEIKNIIEDRPLTGQEQYELAQQITYINALGKDHPLVIQESGSTKKYENLTQLSRAELRKLSDSLIAMVRRLDISDSDKLKAQLNLLAVVREHYFRATGQFVTTTQLMTVLMSLKNQHNNLLIEINTGEGRDITTALLAVMQWVDAKGGTVDVCTANRNLVVHDYEDNGNKDFFASLGINSSQIEASSPKNTYQPGGINYSTVGDLALYRARARLENESLISEKAHPSFHLLLDADCSALDDRTLFNLSVSTEEKEGQNPYAWIYPLVNEFITLDAFKNIDPLTCWSENEDITELRAFLDKKADTSEHKAQLNALPESTFNLWINSAISAARLVEGTDFKILESTTKVHVAVPYILKMPQKESTFGKGIQQFLHARLQKEYESRNWIFSIDPEMLILSSASARDLMNEYKEHGRVLSISGALGTQEELLELGDKFNMDVAWRIPPHRKSKSAALASQVTPMQKQQNEAAAVAHYYLETVSGIQEVVLKQFDEWQALLQLLVPKAELGQLNNELLLQREVLICTLGEQWQKCLNDSNPGKKYPNPYERRDLAGQLVTVDLDTALQNFETETCTVWEKQCAVLKEKAQAHIKDGSVDALRCNYMVNVSLSEQLKLRTIQKRRAKKEAYQEKKKASRYRVSGLDINGAMLEYSDGDLEDYRKSFVLAQVELFKKELIKIIENNVFLNKSVKITLLAEVRSAVSLDALVVILNAYPGTLQANRYNQKYSMQPIIQQLLFIYDKTDLPETESLRELRENYLDKVSDELVDNLKNTLSWAEKGNQGLGYWLERTAVTNAASEILQKVAMLKASKTGEERQLAIKNLYKVLLEHKVQLEDVWIFSFGHKNTRTLINETLVTLDGLTTIGSDEHAIGADFIHECKEEAVNVVMQKKLAFAMEKLKRKTKPLAIDQEWNELLGALDLINRKCSNIYVFNEMNDFLARKIDGLGKIQSKLLAPVIQLRGELRTIWDELEEKYQDILDKSKYFKYKAEQIKAQLGSTVSSVALKVGHNGFSDYFDLIIEAKGGHPLLASFIQYNPQIKGLVEKGSAIQEELERKTELVFSLDKLIKEQLPLLNSNIKISVNLEQFPEDLREQVKTILKLKAYAFGEFPEDLSVFDASVQHHFHDVRLLQTLVFPDLNLALINEVNNPEIKEQLHALYGKINPPPKAPPGYLNGLVSSLWNGVSGMFFKQESTQDWYEQFEALKSDVSALLKAALDSDIDKKQMDLGTKLKFLYEDALSLEDKLKTKQVFLSNKISEEKAKGGVYCKRFKDQAELYDFEKQIDAFNGAAEGSEFSESNVLEEEGGVFYSENDGFQNPNPMS